MQKLILHSFALLILLTAFVNAVFPDIPDVEGGCVYAPNPCQTKEPKNYSEEFCTKTHCCTNPCTGVKTPVTASEWAGGSCCKSELSICNCDSECCSGFCDNGICATRQPPVTCRNNGKTCTDPTECCSNNCVNNVCSAICKNDGLACSTNDECCSNNCIEGVCRTPEAGVDKTVTIKGKRIRVQISQNVIYINGVRYGPGDERLHIIPISDLPTGVPIEGVGITIGQNIAIFVNSTTALVVNQSLLGIVPAGKPNGERCAASSECASTLCSSGTCTSVIVKDGSIVSPSQSPTNVLVGDRKVPVTLSNIFGWNRTKAYLNCIRGTVCTSSNDCCGAQCSDGYCLCGMNACSASGECCSGYCEDGQCKVAPTMSSFLLSKPLQGCAGLVEECLPGEGSCVAICGGLTLLMLVSAVGSGFVAWQRFAHPVPGIAVAMIPIFVGLLMYTFVGIVSAIVMIAMLTYLKGEAKVMPFEVGGAILPSQKGVKRKV